MENEKVRVNVYLYPDVKAKAEKKAKDLGISLTALMTIALQEYLKQDSVIEMAELFKKLQQGQ